MTQQNATDTEWLEWIEIQKQATTLWIGGSSARAITLLDRFITSNPPQDLRTDAIAFRGSIHEDQGNLKQARADWLSALRLARDYGFAHYSLELSLAALCQRQGELEEAEEWCVAGLRTAAADPREVGAGVLLRLLKLRGDRELTVDEKELAHEVVDQAWHLLRIEGMPDLNDLEGTAQKLIAAQSGPFSADRPPTPKTTK